MQASFRLAEGRDAGRAVDQVDGIVRWLMLNRRGLTVLVRPEIGHDLEDHRNRALWMGRILDPNLDVLG